MFGTHAQAMVSDEVPIHARPRLNCSTKNVDNGLTNNLMSTHVVSTQHNDNGIKRCCSLGHTSIIVNITSLTPVDRYDNKAAFLENIKFDAK